MAKFIRAKHSVYLNAAHIHRINRNADGTWSAYGAAGDIWELPSTFDPETVLAEVILDADREAAK